MEALDAGEIRGLLLVGADPIRDMPDPRSAAEGLEAAEYVIALDLFRNDSNEHADVILPAAGFAEKEGTVTNVEGRVQKVNRLRPAPGAARPDWSILDDIASQVGRPLGFASAEAIAKEITESVPLYTGVTHDHLEWEARDGVVVPMDGDQPFDHIPVALDGPRSPGAEFTVHRARTMYDDGARLRHCPSLHPLAPGAVAHLNPADAPGLGVKEGARVRVTTGHGEGEFAAVLDEGTPRGVVYVPVNQAGGAPLGTDPVGRIRVVQASDGGSG
jgi:predicted molibdopterin-dependent oxidoreductase YjgC